MDHWESKKEVMTNNGALGEQTRKEAYSTTRKVKEEMHTLDR